MLTLPALQTEENVIIYIHRCCVCVCVCVSHSVMPDSLRPHGLQPTSLLCPWDSPGKSTGVDCHSLLHRSCLKEKKGNETKLFGNEMADFKCYSLCL